MNLGLAGSGEGTRSVYKRELRLSSGSGTVDSKEAGRKEG